MPSTKYEIEKFTGVNDFGLWRLKMKSLLVQQGCLEALKGESAMNETLTAAEKTTMIEKAPNAILLSLGDKVFRQVSKETTTTGLWVKTVASNTSRYTVEPKNRVTAMCS